MVPQRTLRTAFEVRGIGLHGGRSAHVIVMPAPPNAGLRFGRRRGGRLIRADACKVVDTRLGTTVAHGAVRLQTVEHWLAALAGLGVDNASLVLAEGTELPVLDGSAGPIIERIQASGIVDQPAGRRYAVIARPVAVHRADGSSARLEPAPQPELIGRYVFRRPVGRQHFQLALCPKTFAAELASARTFAFASDVAAYQQAGRALGGGLDNAVVWGPDGPLNSEGLRFANEVARHKLLDAVGDLALIGRPWIGRYVGHRSGHALNVALVRRALQTPGALRFSDQPPR